MKNNQEGVTIIELMIAISVAVVVSGAMVLITITFYGNTIRSQIKSKLAVDSHLALRSFVEDIRLASSIGATNTLNDDNEPGAGWTTDSSASSIVINKPATDSEENVIYDNDTDDPYLNEFIYFLEDGSLMKRVLENELAAGNDEDTTCPEEVSGSSCPADLELVDYVTDFSFELLDSENNATNDPTLARSIRVTLDMQRNAFGDPVTISNTLTTSLRNY